MAAKKIKKTKTVTKPKAKTATKVVKRTKKVIKTVALTPEEETKKFLSGAKAVLKDDKPLPKHFNWRALKLNGIWDGRPGKWQASDPWYKYAGYPKDIIFDPEGTGLKLVEMKKRPKRLLPEEVLWKVDRRRFLKGLTEEERAMYREEMLSVEYFAITNRQKFIMATSFGPRGMTPVDDAQTVGPSLGWTPEELAGRSKPKTDNKAKPRKKKVVKKATGKKTPAKPTASRQKNVVKKPANQPKKMAAGPKKAPRPRKKKLN